MLAAWLLGSSLVSASVPQAYLDEAFAYPELRGALGSSSTPYEPRSGVVWSTDGSRTFKRRQIARFCEDLLSMSQPLRWVNVRNAPGLKLLRTENHPGAVKFETIVNNPRGEFEVHELVSTARYARKINEDKGESVVLTASIAGISTPAFDGVVLDSQGEIIANYSLKTLVKSRGDHMAVLTAKTGADRVKDYATVEKWLKLVGPIEEDGRGRLYLASRDDYVERITEWLASSMRLFGMNGSGGRVRPTRVVVDVRAAPLPDAEGYDRLLNKVRNSQGLVESITLMKGDHFVEIR